MAVMMASGLVANATLANTDDEAHHPRNYYDYAEVVDVDPILRRSWESTPRQECRSEPVRVEYLDRKDRGRHRETSHQSTALPTLVGGVLGGVLGKQFGDGHGRTALTIAGALIGASIGKNAATRSDLDRGPQGNSRARPYEVRHEMRERCTFVEDFHEVERVDGYRVTYLYKGHEFVRNMAEYPGSRVRIRVHVSPA